jgi:hypothetical protein
MARVNLNAIATAAPDEGALSLVAHGDGTFALGGFIDDNVNRYFAIVRMTSAGALDTSFSTDGYDVLSGIGEPLGGGGSWLGPDMAVAVDGRYQIVSAYAGGANEELVLVQYDTIQIADFGGGTTWASAQLFGACLRQLTGTGNSPTWPVATGNDCTIGEDADWHGVATTADKVAASTTSTTVDVTARFRFGLKLPLAQAPGSYMAPITFEVVAPNS